MANETEDPVEETPTQVREGENVQGMTSVLFWSITLVVIVFVIIFGVLIAHEKGWLH